MAELWVWADPHLDHDVIRTYCDRPFGSVDEMNEALIANYRECVKPGDDVVFLGDYAFRNHLQHLARLPGNKTFVFGNHDHMSMDVLRQFTRVVGAKHCPGILEMSVGPFRLTFSHFPLASWNGTFHGSWNIHGHCHGRMPEAPDMLRMDAGVDVFNYRPVNFEVIRIQMEARIPAWKERMRGLQSKSGDAWADANRRRADASVSEWKAQLAANPVRFVIDYRQRYTKAHCPSKCDCSFRPHKEERL